VSEVIFEEKKDNYLISTDKAKLDFDIIYNFLTNCYWAKGISPETVKKSVENSECFGVYENEKLVGFARVISDKATIAYLGDVFILPAYRGKGLSKWLMACIMKHPEFQQFRRWILLTRDAHELYKQFGFKEIEKPDRYMELTNQEVYLKKG
jgi:N-acetylglutamate synthase-like GNAT family acetyltransferase